MYYSNANTADATVFNASYSSSATFVNNTTLRTSHYFSANIIWAFPIPTPTEMSEAERNEIKEENRLREEARVEAEELLLAYVGEKRFKEYKETGSISLKSPSNPTKTYKVNAFDEIKIYEDGKVIDRLCVHLLNGYKRDSYWLPEADVVLGKIFLLENDEERLLSVANHDNRI